MEQSIEQKKGTTTVGIIAADGVVLASETKATLGYLVSSKEAKKVFKVDDRIALTISGGVGDAQQLVRILKAEINLYKLEREEITVNAVTTLLSNILQSSRIFPLLTMLVVGGADKKGYHLFNIDPLGGITEDRYTSTGSGSPIAFGVLEQGFREGMTKDEAVKLAVQSIKSARERDIFSGGKKIDVAVIDNNGVRFLEHEKIEGLMK